MELRMWMELRMTTWMLKATPPHQNPLQLMENRLKMNDIMAYSVTKLVKSIAV